jgi:hypothetical protein
MDTLLGTLSQYDFGAQWITALFADGDSPLNSALTIASLALVCLASAMVAWHIISGIVATAHDGRVLGQRWHQIWAPIRVVVGIGLLLPIPGVGMSSGQLLVRELAGTGSAMANQVWSVFSDSVLGSGATVVPVSAHGRALARELLVLETCNFAVGMESTATGDDYPQPDAGGTIGSAGVAWTYAPVCGSLRYTMPADHPNFATTRRQAVANMISEMRTKAAVLVSSLMPGTTVALDPSAAAALVRWIDTIGTDFDSAIAKAAAVEAASVESDTREKLSEYTSQHGWVTAGTYWRTLSQSSEIAIGLTSENFEVEQPRSRVATRFGSSEPALPDVQNSVVALQAYLNTGGSEARLSASDLAFAGDADTDFLTRILSPLRDVVASALTVDATTDPVGDLMSLGHGLIAGAEVAVAAGTVASAAGTNIVGDAVGLGGVTSWLQPMARLAIYAIGAAGIVLAYVLPMLPYVFTLLLAAGWLVFVLEAKIAVVVWAFLWCRLDGNDLVSDMQKPGMMLLFNIVLRPTLGVLALCGSYILMAALISFVRETFGLAFAGSQGSHVVGLTGLVVGVLLLTYLQWKVMTRLFELISEMPDKISRWFGHTGEHLGEAHAGSTIIAGSIGGTAQALQRAAPAPRPTLPARPSSDPGTAAGGARSAGSVGGARSAG